MPALPLPKYGLDKLYLFRVFQDQEEYRQVTGMEPPEYSDRRPPKFWFDPKAMESPRRNVIYDQVIALGANGMPVAGPDGKPVLEPLVLLREEAATVNIPPRVKGVMLGPAEPSVPVPLRALEEDEELVFEFGGAVGVRNKKLWEELAAGGFSAEDRALLKAIAKKLGV
jgi:hypothetical protein